MNGAAITEYLTMPTMTVNDTTCIAEDRPLWWHLKGLQYTSSGYGRRIPTRWMVRYNGRDRRVYACCYSNAATYYVDGPRNADGTRGPWLIVRA